MKKELVWNVYRYNINQRQIETYNIFNHGGFYESLYKLKTKYLKRDNFQFDLFTEELRKDLMYYFWSKSEYEIIITELFSHITDKELDRINKEREERIKQYGNFYGVDVNLDVEKKIDIYQQIMDNWEAFKEYLFNNYKLIKKGKY